MPHIPEFQLLSVYPKSLITTPVRLSKQLQGFILKFKFSKSYKAEAPNPTSVNTFTASLSFTK